MMFCPYMFRNILYTSFLLLNSVTWRWQQRSSSTWWPRTRRKWCFLGMRAQTWRGQLPRFQNGGIYHRYDIKNINTSYSSQTITFLSFCSLLFPLNNFTIRMIGASNNTTGRMLFNFLTLKTCSQWMNSAILILSTGNLGLYNGHGKALPLFYSCRTHICQRKPTDRVIYDHDYDPICLAVCLVQDSCLSVRVSGGGKTSTNKWHISCKHVQWDSAVERMFA